ncbi:MAG: succinylglutamate desuccinylase/aspartoacylase family protein [Pseudomonadota bacterium]|nr:succinylglutamate desuccinylase/aspartoacylase family protein [Pseudomonadota bacterium]
MTGTVRTHAPPAIEVRFPDIERWAEGNIGLPYVWSFRSPAPGPHTLVQALTHGNEVCGAIALDWALRNAVRPTRGCLTFCFANVEAYHAFDPADPYASRCVQEDFNRVWSEPVLQSTRTSPELRRARSLKPLYDTVDTLLDLHSMTDPCVPLAMAGTLAKGIALARGVGIPEHIVVDGGHAAGKRLRDYAFFDAPDDPRSALLLECGQHWERAAANVAQESVVRFVAHTGQLDPSLALPPSATRQRVLEVTDAITIASDDFAFAVPVHGLAVIENAGTMLARDGSVVIRTPYDHCVLVMPTRRPRVGETAVRLARYVD